MTGKILSFVDYMRAIDDRDDNLPVDSDTFLLDEGLDLLATYRSIGDQVMRLKIKALVEMIASNQRR